MSLSTARILTVARRDYLATVELTPDGTGTAVRWGATYAPTFLGRLARRKLQSVYERCVRDLCAAGDRLAAGSGVPRRP